MPVTAIRRVFLYENGFTVIHLIHNNACIMAMAYYRLVSLTTALMKTRNKCQLPRCALLFTVKYTEKLIKFPYS